MAAQVWYRGRSWREMAAALWALIVSEVVGLILVGLLHAGRLQPAYMEWWPYGYAGLVPLRAFAVFAMTAALVRRQSRLYGRVAEGVAALLVILSGLGVIWSRTQTLTETMLEFAAGGLVLFAGLWWLEGYGPGLVQAANVTADGPREAPEETVPAVSTESPQSPSAG
jgi:hypothetical protein